MCVPLLFTSLSVFSAYFHAAVQETERQDVTVTSEVQPPKAAKKSKPTAAGSQSAGMKKEKKGKPKGQLAACRPVWRSMPDRGETDRAGF